MSDSKFLYKSVSMLLPLSPKGFVPKFRMHAAGGQQGLGVPRLTYSSDMISLNISASRSPSTHSASCPPVASFSSTCSEGDFLR